MHLIKEEKRAIFNITVFVFSALMSRLDELGDKYQEAFVPAMWAVSYVTLP